MLTTVETHYSVDGTETRYALCFQVLELYVPRLILDYLPKNIFKITVDEQQRI